MAPLPSRINLKPSFWGNYGWSFLYTIALGYPSTPSEDEKQAVVNMLQSFVYLLPCETCRTNFKNEIEVDPPVNHVGSSVELLAYINALNNSVSRRLNKPERSVAEVLERLYLRNGLSQKDAIFVAESQSASYQYLHLIWIVLLVGAITAVLTWGITRSVLVRKNTKLYV